MARTATYRLPWPPTVNSYWGSRCTPKGIPILYLTADAKEFRRQVLDAIREPEPMHGRLAVHLELVAPTKRQYDLDNRCKGVLDALQHAGVFADDEQIDELRVTRLHVESPGCCDVTITEIEP